LTPKPAVENKFGVAGRRELDSKGAVMLCDTAIELLRDLQRDSILPPYDVSDVTACVHCAAACASPAAWS
jgi:hypothetical protein